MARSLQPKPFGEQFGLLNERIAIAILNAFGFLKHDKCYNRGYYKDR